MHLWIPTPVNSTKTVIIPKSARVYKPRVDRHGAPCPWTLNTPGGHYLSRENPSSLLTVSVEDLD